MRLPFRIGKIEPPPSMDDDPATITARTPPPASQNRHEAEAEQARARAKELERARDALAARLERLEKMLADPEAGQNAILYYRLRAIWDMSRHSLEVMARRFHEKYKTQDVDDDKTGLPLDKRRAINILLIALAQEYYLVYREDQIAEMARQTVRKTVEDVHFGLAEECLEFGLKARELVARARGENNLGEPLRRRAKYLHGRLRFDENASVPFAGSLNSLPTRVAGTEGPLNEQTEFVPVNVLSLNYWNLNDILLR